MIEKVNKKYRIICDSCGEIFPNKFKTFLDTVTYKKKSGWRSVKLSEDKWNEICSDCVEFEKKLKI